ncbi:Kazal type serine protease inhibitor 1, isoform CRA_b [Rattus norvegicus]|uniref:Kazal type serine protease inhibitor 1, isoform CRA_b n=1 Tax=Rattus norvegicus TaxID=10116 RepID=A6KUC7_RAT|nr:Kazal type serine protease inhibitor 1, isoform CRA_b [Rattus norvegicus]
MRRRLHNNPSSGIQRNKEGTENVRSEKGGVPSVKEDRLIVVSSVIPRSSALGNLTHSVALMARHMGINVPSARHWRKVLERST